MKCNKCGENIPDNSLFCEFCGNRIEKTFPKVNGETTICKNCGSLIEKDSYFCEVCGSKIFKKDSFDENSLPTHEETNRSSSNFYQEQKKSINQNSSGISGKEKNIICDKCGKTIPNDNGFCPFCGSRTNTISGSNINNIKTDSSLQYKKIANNKINLWFIIFVFVIVSIGLIGFVFRDQIISAFSSDDSKNSIVNNVTDTTDNNSMVNSSSSDNISNNNLDTAQTIPQENTQNTSSNSESINNSESSNTKQGIVFVTANASPKQIKVRKTPSLNGDDTKLRKKDGDTVTVYEITEADGYTWYRIGENEWMAGNNTTFGVHFITSTEDNETISSNNYSQSKNTNNQVDNTNTLSNESNANIEINKTYNNNLLGFSLKGKWKNIGQYTYGQVQSNAIVIFDGTNCNFYSPKDTYAFYKDGDNYRLDCTSYIFSQTVSFTVKLVDYNHIDVYNGNYGILELQRVE